MEKFSDLLQPMRVCADSKIISHNANELSLSDTVQRTFVGQNPFKFNILVRRIVNIFP